ncbi:hypothetical protein ACWKWK_17170 [Pseudoxanthomonas beigongshangi]
MLLSWVLAWLVMLPFAQATSTFPPAETVHAAGLCTWAAPIALAEDGEHGKSGWQAPAQTELAALEPLPDRESDPTAGTMSAPRHAMPFRRQATVVHGDIHFRPDSCLPPHGHAPPHA